MATSIVPYDEEHAIYIAPDGGTTIDVRLEKETVWLTSAQMAELFGRHHSVIRKHVQAIFREGELPEANNAQNLRVNRRGRPDTAYSLEVIISVGFRAKSQRATAFRIWANKVVKDRLIQDYKRRAEEAQNVLAGLKNIELLARGPDRVGPEDATAALELIERYARSWRLLLQYDENQLPPAPTRAAKRMQRLTIKQANTLINRFKQALAESGQATDLFGRVRDDGLASILGNLEQTYGGDPLYPNVETRAANLLYMVIKDHPFLDGNKRIGSFLFLHYLSKNERPLLEESALVALALLIAESNPKHKDVIIRLIISLMQETTTPHH